MTLGELIDVLSSYAPGTVVLHGFSDPHSYRGYYDRLAFEPCGETTVGAMLECAKEADGSTYTGYKGGDFRMDKETECYLAEHGNTGEELSETMVRLMINEAVVVSKKGEVANLKKKLAKTEAALEAANRAIECAGIDSSLCSPADIVRRAKEVALKEAIVKVACTYRLEGGSDNELLEAVDKLLDLRAGEDWKP